MKNKYPLFIALVIAAIFGCNKVVNNLPYVPAVPTLPGKWYINKSLADIYFYGTFVRADTISTYTANDYIQFNNDGTGFITDTLPGMPKHNFNYIYTPKDSLHVFLYQYLNTDSASADTMTLTSFKLKTMSWQHSITSVAVDLTETDTYNYFFTKAN